MKTVVGCGDGGRTPQTLGDAMLESRDRAGSGGRLALRPSAPSTLRENNPRACSRMAVEIGSRESVCVLFSSLATALLFLGGDLARHSSLVTGHCSWSAASAQASFPARRAREKTGVEKENGTERKSKPDSVRNPTAGVDQRSRRPLPMWGCSTTEGGGENFETEI
jgi:hypothetical protein